MHPKDSWVGRWQRVGKKLELCYLMHMFNSTFLIDKFQKGVYAIVVYGRVPEDVEDELDRRGVTYRPRDGSVKD
jgi:transcription elongation factor SPT4